MTYIYKRQLIQLKFGKTKQMARGKLNKPNMFPITLQHETLNWKVSLQYELDGDNFVLFINEKPFLAYHFKANASSPEAMIIEGGQIKINGVEVHSGRCIWT